MRVCMQIATKRALDFMAFRRLQNWTSKFPINGRAIVKREQHERRSIQGPEMVCDGRYWIDL